MINGPPKSWNLKALHTQKCKNARALTHMRSLHFRCRWICCSVCSISISYFPSLDCRYVLCGCPVKAVTHLRCILMPQYAYKEKHSTAINRSNVNTATSTAVTNLLCPMHITRRDGPVGHHVVALQNAHGFVACLSWAFRNVERRKRRKIGPSCYSMCLGH